MPRGECAADCERRFLENAAKIPNREKKDKFATKCNFLFAIREMRNCTWQVLFSDAGGLRGVLQERTEEATLHKRKKAGRGAGKG
jgi:hypothetical protein